MAGFNDWLGQQGIQSGEPLDTGVSGGETRPYTTFNDYLKSSGQEPVTIDQNVVQEVSKPLSESAQAGITYQQEKQAERKADTSAFDIQSRVMGGAGAGGEVQDQFTAEEEARVRGVPSEQVYAQRNEIAKEYLRDEGLPTLGGTLATLAAAPFTGGMSVVAGVALIGGAAAIGGAVGEAAEQGLKEEGIIYRSMDEEPIRDGYDFSKRVALRGVEEGAWAVLPEMLIRGGSTLIKGMLAPQGAKPSKAAADMIRVVEEEYAYRMAKGPVQPGATQTLYTAADMYDTAFLHFSEQLTANTAIRTSSVQELRNIKAMRESLVDAAVKRKVGGFAEEAAQKAPIEELAQPLGTQREAARALGVEVQDLTDSQIEHHVRTSLANLNELGVASIIESAFKKAEKVQSSVAGSIYREIDEALRIPNSVVPRGSKARTRFYETGRTSGGKPLYSPLSEYRPTGGYLDYSVDVSDLQSSLWKEFQEVAVAGGAIPPDTAKMMALPKQLEFVEAYETLKFLKDHKLELEKAISGAQVPPGVKKELRIYNSGIKYLETQLMESAMRAEANGVTSASGRPISEMMSEANRLWAIKTQDFQNKYIRKILMNADGVDGAPESLAKQFMKNQRSANNILNVLDDPLVKDLPEIQAAKAAIKGSIVKDLFAPMDVVRGGPRAPNWRQVEAKKEELVSLFGKDGYEDIQRLANAQAYINGEMRSNLFSFSQPTREAGILYKMVGTMLPASVGGASFAAGVAGPAIALGIMVEGTAKVLADPMFLKKLATLSEGKVNVYTARQLAFGLIHQVENAKSAELSVKSKEWYEKKKDESEAYQTYLNNFNKQ